jgi:hypothetical protein
LVRDASGAAGVLIPPLQGRDDRAARTAMKLKDQVAIITGAGRNIGEDTA